MTRRTSAGKGRLAVLGVLLAAVIALVVVLAGADDDRKTVYVTVAKAPGVIAGQHVRSGGTIVGEVADISPVDRGRRARLAIALEDDVWPLPKGSRFTVRWGGTISLYNRYLDLDRSKHGPAMVQDGGDLPTSALRVPVDYGDLLDVFDTGTRADLKDFINTSGVALDRSGPVLGKALGPTPGAVDEADQVLSTLDESRADVEALVRSTDRVVDAVQRADPGLSELVVGAGTTLSALAADVGALQSTLDQAPSTFRRAQVTLARADGTLRAAQTATRRLAPGVTQLRRIASPLNALLGRLNEVGPNARATLTTVGGAAPDITKLVARLQKEAPQLTSIAEQANVSLDCIRPYTPEIVSLGTLWSSALSGVDGAGKYIRAIPSVGAPLANNQSYENSADVAAKNPGLTYAFPRPPGTQAGQPWFLPECGAGPDALDPNKDPEARDFDPLMQIPTEGKKR